MSTYSTTYPVGTTLRSQIQFGVLMSLGAHDLCYIPSVTGSDILGGLTFKARILPFTKSGKRGSAARIMDVTIMLNGMDYYDITVTYARNGHPFERVEHARVTDVDVSTLNRALLALDYDGMQVLNPRYYTNEV